MNNPNPEHPVIQRFAILQSVWRRVHKPSRRTMEQLQQSGAAVDYWKDYTPKPSRCNRRPVGNTAMRLSSAPRHSALMIAHSIHSVEGTEPRLNHLPQSWVPTRLEMQSWNIKLDIWLHNHGIYSDHVLKSNLIE